MTSTERLIYEHLRCAPIGMCPEALASELAVVIGHVPENGHPKSGAHSGELATLAYVLDRQTQQFEQDLAKATKIMGSAMANLPRAHRSNGPA